jgi:hypothetical protein
VGEASLTDVVDATTVKTEIEKEDGLLVAEDDTEGLLEIIMEMVEVLLFALGS